MGHTTPLSFDLTTSQQADHFDLTNPNQILAGHSTNVYEGLCQVWTDTGCEDPISVSENVYKYNKIVVNIVYINQ